MRIQGRVLATKCIIAASLAIGTSSSYSQDGPPSDADSTAVPLEERPLAEKMKLGLSRKWAQHVKSLAERPAPPLERPLFLPADNERSFEAAVPAPQRQSLARQARNEYVEPDVLSSKDGELKVTLVAGHARNHIGADPVYLRSFNGKLVGPTLRVKPGDKVRITLKNVMPGERWLPHMMNTLNSFNTLNLHYHGLHVSPNGISDNVLIQVGPRETQEYELNIPRNHTTGTYWYHPHRHGSTAGDVASSMSGTLIIEAHAGEKGLDNIPEIKAAHQRVMVLNQIPYIYKNTLPDPNSTAQPPATVTFDLKEGRVEVEYAAYIFGPGDWVKLGRYTTVNGVQLPVIRMRPGQIERWRLVDSGQREMIMLKIIPNPSAATPQIAPINFHEIAVDGLALGKIVETPTIELWPGYRSDALVQAPMVPGEYLLIDDVAPASNTISGSPKPLNYVARIVIEGAPQAMKMPTDAQMAGLRLPSIKDSEITGKQEAKYGILLVGQGADQTVVFTIDGAPFTMETARTLKLNDVDEWTIRSINDVGPVTHPFHIHVNPFEVTSIMAPSAEDPAKLVEQLKNGPVWRDTVKIPGNGLVKMRTKYTDFIGTFVQHCHILDHEDQGMMQLIDIIDPKSPQVADANSIPRVQTTSPDFVLPDSSGQKHRLSELQDGPSIVFFFKGHGCLHCAQQVNAFMQHYEAFKRRGVKVIGVTSDSVDVLKSALEARPCPFTLLSDAQGKGFAEFGCVNTDGLLHGSFCIDERRQIKWSSVGASPYLLVQDLLKKTLNDSSVLNNSQPDLGRLSGLSDASGLVGASETDSAAEAESGNANEKSTQLTLADSATTVPPTLELEVFNTPARDDDYITWAPSPCRIRISNPGSVMEDLRVVLTNDPPKAIPMGRTVPLDGDILFDTSVASGKTACKSMLELVLPKNGDWVPFVIAGKFPQASTEDKDAAIEIHQGTSNGTLLQTQSVMVRIRKDHRSLTDNERQRFLEAIDHLHRGTMQADGESRYTYFVHLHEMTAIGLRLGEDPRVKYYWPDLAHKAPGFIAWHRAFLLEFERELQKTHPDVALPYWVMPEKSQLFDESFIGANTVQTDGGNTPVLAKLSPNNPIYNWKIGTTSLYRWAVDREPGSAGFPPFSTDKVLFQKSVFSAYPQRNLGFVDVMEQNPHNIGHNWTGPWMQDCAISPSDPIFWVFHAGFDRQWARWQYLNGRFDPSGAGDSFCPLGDFDKPGPACGTGGATDCNSQGANPCVPVNHHLNDKLWPWNKVVGKGEYLKNSYPQADLATPFLHMFPASVVPGLWPAGDTQPTGADTIDYLALNPGRLPLGFAYDDSPFGKAEKPMPLTPSSKEPVKTFADKSLSIEERLDAVAQLSPAAAHDPAEIDTLLRTLKSTTEHESIRFRALQIARDSGSPQWIDGAIGILKSSTDGGEKLDAEVVKALASSLMFTAAGAERRADIMPALTGALSDPREQVRLSALWSLVPMRHSNHAIDMAVESLRQPKNAMFRPAHAIIAISLANRTLEHAAAIRPYLTNADPAVRESAITALAGDVDSRKTIRELLSDRQQPDAVRSAAIQSLLTSGLEELPAVLQIAVDSQNAISLRAEAVAAVGVLVRTTQVALSKEQLSDIVDRLSSIKPADAQRMGPVVARTVLSATQRLR